MRTFWPVGVFWFVIPVLVVAVAVVALRPSDQAVWVGSAGAPTVSAPAASVRPSLAPEPQDLSGAREIAYGIPIVIRGPGPTTPSTVGTEDTEPEIAEPGSSEAEVAEEYVNHHRPTVVETVNPEVADPDSPVPSEPQEVEDTVTATTVPATTIPATTVPGATDLTEPGTDFVCGTVNGCGPVDPSPDPADPSP